MSGCICRVALSPDVSDWTNCCWQPPSHPSMSSGNGSRWRAFHSPLPSHWTTCPGVGLGFPWYWLSHRCPACGIHAISCTGSLCLVQQIGEGAENKVADRAKSQKQSRAAGQAGIGSSSWGCETCLPKVGFQWSKWCKSYITFIPLSGLHTRLELHKSNPLFTSRLVGNW